MMSIACVVFAAHSRSISIDTRAHGHEPFSGRDTQLEKEIEGVGEYTIHDMQVILDSFAAGLTHAAPL